MAQPSTDRTGRIQPKTNGAEGDGEQGRSLLKVLLEDSSQDEIRRAVPPKVLSPDRMIRIAMTALKSTRHLNECSAHTFFGCLIQAAQLGLEVNTQLGHAWLIPRRNKKLETRLKSPKPMYDCTLMLGYQGMIELSMRSNRMTEITAMAVREGDHFKRKYGLNAILDHEPSEEPDRESKEITHVWALARLVNGGQPWLALSRPQIEARRLRSASPNEGPWVTDYEPMACKSAIRALWKVLPKSSEMALADSIDLAADMGRSQANVFDAKVAAAIERQGLTPLMSGDEEDLDAMQFNQVTGEVHAGQETLV